MTASRAAGDGAFRRLAGERIEPLSSETQKSTLAYSSEMRDTAIAFRRGKLLSYRINHDRAPQADGKPAGNCGSSMVGRSADAST
jgi:hypothetical protein